MKKCKRCKTNFWPGSSKQIYCAYCSGKSYRYRKWAKRKRRVVYKRFAFGARKSEFETIVNFQNKHRLNFSEVFEVAIYLLRREFDNLTEGEVNQIVWKRRKKVGEAMKSKPAGGLGQV